MKKVLAIPALLCSLISAYAQIDYPGQPFDWPDNRLSQEVPVFETAIPDRSLLSIEDLANDEHKEFGYRFGVEYSFDLDCVNQAHREEYLAHMIWQTALHCPEATSMNFTFSDFFLPKGAKLLIWEVDGDQLLGAYDHRSNPDGGSFAVGLIYSDMVVIEIQADVDTDISLIDVRLGEVIYGYRDILSRWYEEEQAWLSGARGPFGNSEPCNVNINCPEGLEWEVEARSVALIVDGGYAACTGALVNNTAQDGTPYFLTADHCLGGEEDWVFYFNHESAGCTGSNGPIDDSVSGSILRANNSDSDFALLELNETPPADYDVQYAGWDNSDNAVPAGTSIHHPSGDVKKIAIDNNDLTQMSWGGSETWRCADWDVGVTEPGSSGAPLFDQNHRIIGQLQGGSAACAGASDNDQPDYYGRFAVSWDGPSASSRLRDWLDPGDSGIEILDGWPEGAITYNNDGAAGGLLDIPEYICNTDEIEVTFRLMNNGSMELIAATIHIMYNGVMLDDILWEGSLLQDEFEDIPLPNFQPISGENELSVTVETPFDENTLNNSNSSSFELSLGQESIEIEIQTDLYGYETYWQLSDPSGTVVLSGGNQNVGPDGAGLTSANNDDPGAYTSEAYYTYSWPASEAGCYTFLIVDDYNDGICCNYGDGYFLVQDAYGTVLAQGAEFGGSEETVFGMAGSGSTAIDEKEALNLKISPNPGSGYYRLDFPQRVQGMRVLNMLGEVVFEDGSAWTGKKSLEVPSLPAGAYILQLDSNSGPVSSRFIQH